MVEKQIAKRAMIDLQGSIETESYEGKNGPAKSNSFIVQGFELLVYLP